MKMKKKWNFNWLWILAIIFCLHGMTVCAEGMGINVTSTDVLLNYENTSIVVATVANGLPAGTELSAAAVDNHIASVEWLQPETYGYTYLKISANNVGETNVMVCAKANPAICTAIHVKVDSIVPTFTFTGSGNQVIGGIGLTSSKAYDVTITNTQERGAFQVYFNGPNGNKLLANAIGSYSGTVRLPAGDVFSNFTVTSQGDWSITIKEVSGTSTSLLGGTGDKVSGWFQGTGKTANISIGNDANKGAFTVWLYDSYGNRKRLVNKVGTYTGVVPVYLASNRMYYIEVISDGNWVVNFNQGVDMANMSYLQ